jgi:hypothetical protein
MTYFALVHLAENPPFGNSKRSMFRSNDDSNRSSTRLVDVSFSKFTSIDHPMCMDFMKYDEFVLHKTLYSENCHSYWCLLREHEGFVAGVRVLSRA